MLENESELSDFDIDFSKGDNEDRDKQYCLENDQGTLGMEVSRRSYDVSSSNEEPVCGVPCSGTLLFLLKFLGLTWTSFWLGVQVSEITKEFKLPTLFHIFEMLFCK